jgi:hypothetical protein
VERLATDLTARFGRGFGRRNLQDMRSFYLCYGLERIRQSLARYALDGLPNKTLVREYLTLLPRERLLADEITKTRRLLEERRP